MPLINFGATPATVRVPVPVGRSFVFSIHGPATGATAVSISYYTGSAWIVLTLLTPNEGIIEATSGQHINYGPINEIEVKSIGNASGTNVNVVINVIPIERALM